MLTHAVLRKMKKLKIIFLPLQTGILKIFYVVKVKTLFFCQNVPRGTFLRGHSEQGEESPANYSQAYRREPLRIRSGRLRRFLDSQFHKKLPINSAMKTFVFSIFILLTLSGCKKPLLNPENTDPIYNDIKKEVDSSLKDARASKKEVEDAKLALQKSRIRTDEREMNMEIYFNAQKKYEKQAEKYRYLVLKLESRKREAQKSYKAAYDQDKPWPDKEEFNMYLTDKRLKQAPREWSPERRIKKRAIASTPKPPSGGGH